MANEVIERPAIVADEHLQFLDELRKSGDVNMFGAAPYIANKIWLNIKDARKILSYWMSTYSERHPKA